MVGMALPCEWGLLMRFLDVPVRQFAENVLAATAPFFSKDIVDIVILLKFMVL